MVDDNTSMVKVQNHERENSYFSGEAKTDFCLPLPRRGTGRHCFWLIRIFRNARWVILQSDWWKMTNFNRNWVSDVELDSNKFRICIGLNGIFERKSVLGESGSSLLHVCLLKSRTIVKYEELLT